MTDLENPVGGTDGVEEDQKPCLDMLSLRWLLTIEVEMSSQCLEYHLILGELSGLELPHGLGNCIKGLNPGILQYLEVGKIRREISPNQGRAVGGVRGTDSQVCP